MVDLSYAYFVRAQVGKHSCSQLEKHAIGLGKLLILSMSSIGICEIVIGCPLSQRKGLYCIVDISYVEDRVNVQSRLKRGDVPRSQ
jgi:hypothetical protein